MGAAFSRDRFGISDYYWVNTKASLLFVIHAGIQKNENWIPGPRIEFGTGKSGMRIDILSPLEGLKEFCFKNLQSKI